jgi:hypothetical protein
VTSIAITGPFAACVRSAAAPADQCPHARPAATPAPRADSTVADPDPIYHLARIHCNDHRRRIKSNLQHRHEPPPPIGLPTESSQAGS